MSEDVKEISASFIEEILAELLEEEDDESETSKIIKDSLSNSLSKYNNYNHVSYYG